MAGGRVSVLVEENVVNWTEVVGTFLIYSKRLLTFLALQLFNFVNCLAKGNWILGQNGCHVIRIMEIVCILSSFCLSCYDRILCEDASFFSP
jgi:hypothetical protein